MRYCVRSELDCKGFGPGFRTVPEASLVSIIVEVSAFDLPICGFELDAGDRSVVVETGSQQIPEVC